MDKNILDKLEVMQGDITQLDVDAVVTAASASGFDTETVASVRLVPAGKLQIAGFGWGLRRAPILRAGRRRSA